MSRYHGSEQGVPPDDTNSEFNLDDFELPTDEEVQWFVNNGHNLNNLNNSFNPDGNSSHLLSGDFGPAQFGPPTQPPQPLQPLQQPGVTIQPAFAAFIPATWHGTNQSHSGGHYQADGQAPGGQQGVNPNSLYPNLGAQSAAPTPPSGGNAPVYSSGGAAGGLFQPGGPPGDYHNSSQAPNFGLGHLTVDTSTGEIDPIDSFEFLNEGSFVHQAGGQAPAGQQGGLYNTPPPDLDQESSAPATPTGKIEPVDPFKLFDGGLFDHQAGWQAPAGQQGVPSNSPQSNLDQGSSVPAPPSDTSASAYPSPGYGAEPYNNQGTGQVSGGQQSLYHSTPSPPNPGDESHVPAPRSYNDAACYPSANSGVVQPGAQYSTSPPLTFGQQSPLPVPPSHPRPSRYLPGGLGVGPLNYQGTGQVSAGQQGVHYGTPPAQNFGYGRPSPAPPSGLYPPIDPFNSFDLGSRNNQPLRQAPAGQHAIPNNTPPALGIGLGSPLPATPTNMHAPRPNLMPAPPARPGPSGNAQRQAGPNTPAKPRTAADFARRFVKRHRDLGNVTTKKETPQNGNLLRKLQDQRVPTSPCPIKTHAAFRRARDAYHNLTRDQEAWNAVQHDATFPRTDPQMHAFVQQLLEAFYDWSNTQNARQDDGRRKTGKRSWSPGHDLSVPEKLDFVNKTRISSHEIGIKCWEILDCAKESQAGNTRIHMWSGKSETSYEVFASFKERWDTICDVVRTNKLFLHSLTRGTYAQRFVNAPCCELKAIESNKTNNSKRAKAKTTQSQASQSQAAQVQAEDQGDEEEEEEEEEEDIPLRRSKRTRNK